MIYWEILLLIGVAMNLKSDFAEKIILPIGKYLFPQISTGCCLTFCVVTIFF